MFQLAVFREKKVDCHVFYLGEAFVMIRTNFPKNLTAAGRDAKKYEIAFTALYIFYI